MTAWLILTENQDGGWLADWDGEIHYTLEEGTAELARCLEALEGRAVLAEVSWGVPGV